MTSSGSTMMSSLETRGARYGLRRHAAVDWAAGDVDPQDDERGRMLGGPNAWGGRGGGPFRTGGPWGADVDETATGMPLAPELLERRRGRERGGLLSERAASRGVFWGASARPISRTMSGRLASEPVRRR
jgi:hypothetical protein